MAKKGLQVNITFDPDIKKVQEMFSSFPDNIRNYLRRASEKSAFKIEGEAKKRTPVDTGRLRSSIASSLGIVGNIGAVVSTNVNYAVYVHEGTRPHFPPASSLETWAKRHNTNAMTVAKAIARRGTKAHPFMKEGAEASERDIAIYFEDEVTKGLQYLKGQL